MACAQCDQLHVLDVIAVSGDDEGNFASEDLIVDNLLIEGRITRQLQEGFFATRTRWDHMESLRERAELEAAEWKNRE